VAMARWGQQPFSVQGFNNVVIPSAPSESKGFDIFDFDTSCFRRRAIVRLRIQLFNQLDSMAFALH